MVDSDPSRLDRSEYERLASRLGVRAVPLESDPAREVVAEIDDVADGGGAVLRKFRVVDEDDVFEYVRAAPNGSIRELLSRGGFLHDFLRSTELNESVDGLDTEDGFSGVHWNDEYASGVTSESGSREFDWYHPLFVDGYLAWVLVRGGAYSSFDGTQAAAKELGRQFERAVIDGRYESVHAWRLADVQWSAWFEGVPHWDETLVLADEDEKIVWLFLFSSTD